MRGGSRVHARHVPGAHFALQAHLPRRRRPIFVIDQIRDERRPRTPWIDGDFHAGSHVPLLGERERLILSQAVFPRPHGGGDGRRIGFPGASVQLEKAALNTCGATCPLTSAVRRGRVPERRRTLHGRGGGVSPRDTSSLAACRPPGYPRLSSLQRVLAALAASAGPRAGHEPAYDRGAASDAVAVDPHDKTARRRTLKLHVHDRVSQAYELTRGLDTEEAAARPRRGSRILRPPARGRRGSAARARCASCRKPARTAASGACGS